MGKRAVDGLVVKPEWEPIEPYLEKWWPRICPDWRASARYGTYKELEGDSGSAEHILQRRVIRILILNPDETPDSGCTEEAAPRDLEETLVHELLHAPFAYMRPPEGDEMAHIVWEQQLENLAVLLVKLDRAAAK